MESCGFGSSWGFVMPYGIAGSSNIFGMLTVTATALGLLGDTQGSSKFFSSSVSFASGDDGQIGSALRALGIFSPGLEELGGLIFKDCIGRTPCAPAGCTNGREVVTCVSSLSSYDKCDRLCNEFLTILGFGTTFEFA